VLGRHRVGVPLVGHTVAWKRPPTPSARANTRVETRSTKKRSPAHRTCRSRRTVAIERGVLAARMETAG